jgi:hypothetical protein
MLVKEANCETIPGDVSIFRGAAGGLSYFSSGSLRVTLEMGASWPEARGTKTSESRQAKRQTFEIRRMIIVRSCYLFNPDLPENGHPRQGKTEKGKS